MKKLNFLERKPFLENLGQLGFVFLHDVVIIPWHWFLERQEVLTKISPTAGTQDGTRTHVRPGSMQWSWTSPSVTPHSNSVCMSVSPIWLRDPWGQNCVVFLANPLAHSTSPGKWWASRTSAVMEMLIWVLTEMVATGHTWLISTWSVTNATCELNSEFLKFPVVLSVNCQRWLKATVVLNRVVLDFSIHLLNE